MPSGVFCMVKKPKVDTLGGLLYRRPIERCPYWRVPTETSSSTGGGACWVAFLPFCNSWMLSPTIHNPTTNMQTMQTKTVFVAQLLGILGRKSFSIFGGFPFVKNDKTRKRPPWLPPVCWLACNRISQRLQGSKRLVWHLLFCGRKLSMHTKNA